jgi:hypothetical protein
VHLGISARLNDANQRCMSRRLLPVFLLLLTVGSRGFSDPWITKKHTRA